MKPKRKKQGDRAAEQFRSSYAWQKQRELIKERDHYLCKACLRENVFTYDGLEVHHIVPLEEAPELGFEEDNLITLCEKHHELAERGGISREDLQELAHTPLPLG